MNVNTAADLIVAHQGTRDLSPPQGQCLPRLTFGVQPASAPL
jgi:hypothetical protein